MSPIARARFEGLDAVEFTTPRMRLVVVTAWGPRIASFGPPGGPNLLLWQPGKYRRGDWDLRGGHRVWATRPGADEGEDTYATDNAPCTVELAPDGFTVTGGENPVNRTQRGIRVRLASDHMLHVDNFLINAGDMLYSGGVWALTCTVPSPGTQYGIPLGDGTEWDAFSMVSFRRWAGHGAGGFGDPQFQITGDVLTIEPKGRENKRMLESHHGIIAMRDPVRNLTFAKRAPLQPGLQYPLGTNLAVYIGPDNFMIEMESMGPERTLRPGESIHHTETWVLREGAAAFDCARTLTDLFA